MLTNTKNLFRTPKQQANEIAEKLYQSYLILSEMTTPDYDEFFRIIKDDKITGNEFDEKIDKFHKQQEKHSQYFTLKCICQTIRLRSRRSLKLEIEFEQAVNDAINNGLIVY